MRSQRNSQNVVFDPQRYWVLPLAAVVIKLRRAIPVEEGYQWVKEGISVRLVHGRMESYDLRSHCFAVTGSLLANGFAMLPDQCIACLVAFVSNVRGLQLAKWRAEEKQRLLGIFPNFYVSYEPNAAPLTAAQKFQLGLRTLIDPEVILGNAIGAGIEQ